jgi:hypothetical protein
VGGIGQFGHNLTLQTIHPFNPGDKQKKKDSDWQKQTPPGGLKPEPPGFFISFLSSPGPVGLRFIFLLRELKHLLVALPTSQGLGAQELPEGNPWGQQTQPSPRCASGNSVEPAWLGSGKPVAQFPSFPVPRHATADW